MYLHVSHFQTNIYAPKQSHSDWVNLYFGTQRFLNPITRYRRGTNAGPRHQFRSNTLCNFIHSPSWYRDVIENEDIVIRNYIPRNSYQGCWRVSLTTQYAWFLDSIQYKLSIVKQYYGILRISDNTILLTTCYTDLE